MFEWPTDGQIRVSWTGAAKVYLLADTHQRALPINLEHGALVISASTAAPVPIVTVLVLAQHL